MTLAARNLAFGFRQREIGHGFDLELRERHVVCVLGPNGAGKTTLFRTLLGLLPALGGTISVDGRDLRALSRAEIARAVAYVPQSSSMAFDFTLHEIVMMGRTAHLGPFAAPSRTDRELARAALERLGIAALAGHPFGEVSGGERQLALIARALASEAGAIVMDEPTASLDFGNQVRVLGEIARLRDDAKAVLMCTHDPGHALEVADEVLLIRDGKIFARGTAADVVTDANLSSLYGIEVRYHGPHARPLDPTRRPT